MMKFLSHRIKPKTEPEPVPVFTDEDLGIQLSPAELRSAILEKRREDMSKKWHDEKSIYSPRMLDIISDDIVKKRERSPSP